METAYYNCNRVSFSSDAIGARLTAIETMTSDRRPTKTTTIELKRLPCDGNFPRIAFHFAVI